MPPNTSSRYKFSQRKEDDAGRLFLTPRRRFLFRELSDTDTHVVSQGETLELLAHQFYGGLNERPSGLYWIIGDFQQPPVFDVTIELTPGLKLDIPSRRAARFVLSEARRPR